MALSLADILGVPGSLSGVGAPASYGGPLAGPGTAWGGRRWTKWSALARWIAAHGGDPAAVLAGHVGLQRAFGQRPAAAGAGVVGTMPGAGAGGGPYNYAIAPPRTTGLPPRSVGGGPSLLGLPPQVGSHAPPPGPGPTPAGPASLASVVAPQPLAQIHYGMPRPRRPRYLASQFASY